MLREAVNDKDKELKETAMHEIEASVEKMESPLHKLEHKLHPLVAYFIMPVFAFANAGVALSAEQFSAAFSSTNPWNLIRTIRWKTSWYYVICIYF